MGLLPHPFRRIYAAVTRLTYRSAAALAIDLLLTAAAVYAAFYIRLEDRDFATRAPYFLAFVGPFVIYAGMVYLFLGIYRSRWRFTSLPDLVEIIKASIFLAVSLLVFDYILISPSLFGNFYFGKLTILLYGVLQIFFLGAPRIAYRYFRSRTLRLAADRSLSPSLIVGRAADAEILLRAIESGAASRLLIAGILSPSAGDRGRVLRGVDVLGDPSELEAVVQSLLQRNVRIGRVVLTASGLAPDSRPEEVLAVARRLGIVISRIPSLDGSQPVQLAPVNVEDLLLRPSVAIDSGPAEAMLAGKSVIVTGGGGSIGSELCRRVLTFGAQRLLVIENSEPALHAVMETLQTMASDCILTGRIADVRDRDRVHRLFAEFGPDYVFHAAALKHVPIVEQDWAEGVKTNVFGTVNVADATAASGASALIMISTDKAIEPLSMLGATKRFAELYCQAIDGERLTGLSSTRAISVRFGNVLGSNGSVVPKFRAQIEAGGPVTITHPDMVRYFMTIREACDLVVAAAANALAPEAQQELSVYVLNMGQPVKIRELAEHMIRLHGLKPMIDIEIVTTGVRPGERIEEILFARDERYIETDIAGVVAASGLSQPLLSMKRWLAELRTAINEEDQRAVYRILADAVPDFKGKAA